MTTGSSRRAGLRTTGANMPTHERHKTTIYDVAELAGVSPSTVSRTFSSPARVSAATAARVQAAARDLGYKTSGSAYWEEADSTYVLGFVIAQFGNPVYTDILKGFQDAASENGYSVIVINSPGSPETEKATLTSVLPFIDGIAFPISQLNPAGIREFERTKPVVLVNRHANGHTCVVADIRQGLHRICEHLQSLGHERVVYLAGPPYSWTSPMRWRALQYECDKRGMHARQMSHLDPLFEGGMSYASEWTPTHGTAVIAFNDVMAAGFLRGIENRGLSVPGDVSIVGFDNSHTVLITNPQLTSLSSGGELIGRKAAQSLIWQNNHRWVRERKSLVVPVEFAIRGSTGPAPMRHM
ncbi:LacI family DNA-binding transcriptional regulator [Trueperella pecoris]|uniref:LacI family DNA-binding transcriptional regulator n=1 Tax=Trueperella pecoris TaxID=2733571 RepID=A0A7M1QTL8_9ACTO|nr:LacI family DNA-binding transcriptional regulator [Trueperella pecoris]QOR44864.1 LacI family DNA-binding transcriptional regulator [Trueperella pecoris]